MEKLPTVLELLTEESKKYSAPLDSQGLQVLVHNVAIQYASNHIEAALKATIKNVKLITKIDPDWGTKYQSIDESSILTAYPLSNLL